MSIITRHKRWLVASTAYLLASAAPSQAQWRFLAPESGQSLTREDLDLQRAAAQSLLAMNPPAPGASKSWENSQSGARGEVSMLRAFEQGGMPCRDLKYFLANSGSTNSTEMVLKLCLTKAGEWKAVD
ncbi:RT0821/Lpp0805 family surface protein [Teichococcus coralli]|nr:RT0821/Lpp0805 family surface protein [Pseudoroseomonas coralli]